ncbi:MAG: hypothetical protein QOK33_1432 [Mycobacterium sp.]|nr:hypothetical protein [Mycobacterium sp.]
MQTPANSSTGHDTIDPRKETTASTFGMCCRCSVWVLDQTSPTSKYGVPITSPTTISSPMETR